ncbi:MAG TPA: DUF3144 domain-containing protein [Gemmataceae bacterium]|jgi:hypothetical protein|nr:DUF3144 domain-containing protein [Gemmataceae bacterium]
MAKDVPPEFYDSVNKFIAVANALFEEHGVARVSAVILFAAARYNAHCLLTSDPDGMKNRDAAVAYFVEQYRSMLEDNIDWLIRQQGDRPDAGPEAAATPESAPGRKPWWRLWA